MIVAFHVLLLQSLEFFPLAHSGGTYLILRQDISWRSPKVWSCKCPFGNIALIPLHMFPYQSYVSAFLYWNIKNVWAACPSRVSDGFFACSAHGVSSCSLFCGHMISLHDHIISYCLTICQHQTMADIKIFEILWRCASPFSFHPYLRKVCRRGAKKEDFEKSSELPHP